METEESIDLSGAPAEDDPFAEVPSDPTLGTPEAPIDLSDGPEEARLGGTDDPPPDEEPPPGSFMEDPDQTELETDLGFTDDEPLGEPVPPEPLQPPEEGGPGYEEQQHEAAAEAAATPKEEPPAEEPIPEPELEEPAAPPPDPDPTPAKGKSPVRTYFVLEQVGEDNGDATFAQRTTVEAHNGEGAIRRAYRELYETTPEEATCLCVVPESMWKPRKVQGRAKRDVAIDIG